MSHIKACDAFFALVEAATDMTVLSGERNPRVPSAQETLRPYVRLSFVRLNVPTDIPGLKVGYALLEVYAVDGVSAWAKGDEMAEALGLNGTMAGGIVAPSRPNDVSHYSWESPGWGKAPDPQKGGKVAGTVGFYYFA